MSKQGQSMAERMQRDAERMQKNAERMQRDAERTQREAEQMQQDAKRMQQDAERMQQDAERHLDIRNAVVLNNYSSGSCKTILSKLENGKFCMRISSEPYHSTMMSIDGQEKIWFITNTPWFIFRKSVFGSNSKEYKINGTPVILVDRYKIVIEKGQTPVVTDSNYQSIELFATTIEYEYTKNLLNSAVVNK